ncbi:MAG: glycosyltransferase family 4 protein [Planctomycetota bacterium]|jgi:glycosyltransferase involved in cell wall biosynthesis
MQLLYLCSDFGIPIDGTKGASVHVRAITGALTRAGHEVRICSPRPPRSPDVCNNGVGVIDSNIHGGHIKNIKRYLEARQINSSLPRELRALHHNVSGADPIVERLADWRPTAIVERLSLYGSLGLDLAERLEVPLVLEVNAPLVQEAQAHRGLQMVDLATSLEDRVLHGADAITTVSEGLASHLESRGVDRRKIVVVPNGVDEGWLALPREDADVRDRLGLAGKTVIGFAGSLKAWHGVDVLIRAFARQQEVDDGSLRLLIVGTGPEENALIKLTELLGLSQSVVFAGAVRHEDMPRYLGLMDVAVAPFRTAPTFYFSPIKLFEYMGMGCCVVASALGQIADVITDGRNGLLCRPDCADDLVRTLQHAVSDPQLRHQIGTRAREDVRARYTWHHAAQSTSRVISDVLDARRRGKITVQHKDVEEESEVPSWRLAQ